MTSPPALLAQSSQRSGCLRLLHREYSTAPPQEELRKPQPASARYSLHSTSSDEVVRSENLDSLLDGSITDFPQPCAAPEADASPSPWWLDVSSASKSEVQSLARTLGLHPLTVEDILSGEDREKLEVFKNYYLVCYRSFDRVDQPSGLLASQNMTIIVFPHGTLTLHFGALPHTAAVEERLKSVGWKQDRELYPAWICYALLDSITDTFVRVIADLGLELDRLEDPLLLNSNTNYITLLRQTTHLGKRLAQARGLLESKGDVVKALARRLNNQAVPATHDVGLHLNDIEDHLITLNKDARYLEEALAKTQTNCLASMSIQSTQASNRTNFALSKLTALGTVIVPLNIITGLWGMNVMVPGQGYEDLTWFAGLSAFMTAIACSAYFGASRYIGRGGDR